MDAPLYKRLFAPTYYPVHNHLNHGRYREYWFQGGRGSCKSSFIGTQIPMRIAAGSSLPRSEQPHAVVYRKVGADLRGSVVNQVQWGIDVLGLSGYFAFNRTTMTFTYRPTGQMIQFRGLDDPTKSKSIKAPFGFYKYLWFEELSQFHGMEEIRSVKQSVLRGGHDFVTFYSYNPPMMTSNWVNVAALEEVTGRLCHKSSYLDVPKEWLGEEFFLEAEDLKRNNELAYRHEYLGEVTGTGGNVFGNVHVRKIEDAELARFDNLHYGLDWGYTNAFTWVACHHDVKRKRLYIFDEIYGHHMTTTIAAEKVKEKDMHFLPIYADSEDANSIAQFNNDYGILTLPVVKGPDSRRFGFRWLQDLHEIVIDPERCPNAAREFVSYEYEKDKFGNFIEEYPKENDHVLDAVRYAMENEAIKRGMF